MKISFSAKKVAHISALLLLVLMFSVVAVSAKQLPIINSVLLNGGSGVSVESGDNITVQVNVSLSASSGGWESTRYQIGTETPVCVNTPNHAHSDSPGVPFIESFVLLVNAGVGTYDFKVIAYQNDFCNSTDSSATKNMPSAIVVNPCTNYTFYQDSDTDTFGNAAVSAIACDAPAGYVSDNTDCDDSDPIIYPSASDAVCNGVDNNCDGNVDEEFVSVPTFCGTGVCASSGSTSCVSGSVIDSCVSGTPSETPETSCDGQDNDCDGSVDNGLIAPLNSNQVGVCVGSSQTCAGVSGWVNDYSSVGSYESPESSCDNLDNNCDGSVDEGVLLSFFQDLDLDLYGNPFVNESACSASPGYVSSSGDADDNDNTIYPGAPELCDGKDNNQDGNVDEGVLITFYQDADGDGFGDSSSTVLACSAPAGYVSDNTDCDDSVSSCNSDCTSLLYQDSDTDTFGNAAVSLRACDAPSGYVADNTDCDDTQLLYSDGDSDGFGAGSPTACGVADNTDCDDADISSWQNLAGYIDGDGDTFGAGAVQTVCSGASLPAGYVSDNTDCDDSVSSCNSDCTSLLYQDSDTDTFGNAAVSLRACDAPAGYVNDSSDCNDADSAISPSAVEVCDSIDNNCDGSVDEGLLSTFFNDSDGDLFGNPFVNETICSTLPASQGYVSDNTDCNDADSAINSNATEVCGDSLDNNCDGSVDEGCTTGGNNGGGGTGGTGGCNTQWTCTDWGVCTAGTQERVCSYPQQLCEPVALKPIEVQSCTMTPSSSSNNGRTTINGTTTPANPSAGNAGAGITGAVIGALGTGGSIAAGIFIAAVIAAAAWFGIKRRKAKRAE